MDQGFSINSAPVYEQMRVMRMRQGPMPALGDEVLEELLRETENDGYTASGAIDDHLFEQERDDDIMLGEQEMQPMLGEQEMLLQENSNDVDNLTVQRIYDHIMFGEEEDEEMRSEDFSSRVYRNTDRDMILTRAEEFLQGLNAAFRQGRIDIHCFQNVMRALRACMEEMTNAYRVQQMDVRTGLTQFEVQARMEVRIVRIHQVMKDVSANVDVGTCGICLEDFADKAELGILNCRHEFHSCCIQPWLVLRNACPICRRIALP